MTGASKILTVSYGTFSCTLEGFDDPFNTMKAIAEYFRDLAAGDRYFGAEPPTPDAAMLHRIAEREIHRRVEAKIQDNGVILRAAEPGLASDFDAVAPATEPAVAAPEVSAESVAARLQRIRAKHALPTAALAPVLAPVLPAVLEDPALVEESFPEETYPEDSYPEDTYSEDQHADADLPLVADLVAAQLADQPEPDADLNEIPDQIEEILDEAENDRAMIEFVDQGEDTPDTPLFEPDLPAPPAAVEDEAAYTAADMTDDLPETSDDALLASLTGALQADQAADQLDREAGFDDAGADAMLEPVETLTATPASYAQDDASLIARLSAGAEAGLPTATETEAPQPDTPVYNDPDLTARDTAERGIDAALLEALSEKSGEIDALGAKPEPDVDDLATPPEPAAPRARARVIRIRRADPQPAPTVTEAAPAAAQITAQGAPAENSALSAEAEAALQAELAALEAEISGLPDDADAPAEDMLEPRPASEPEISVAAVAPATAHRHEISAPAANGSVNRLMDQAGAEMSDDETRRRQSAIAHLKAAVAATEADRRVLGSSGPRPEERIEPYRNDLDRVVRPRRPVASTSAAAAAVTPTPEPQAPVAAPAAAAPRATPLVLVSAQRIDRAPEHATTPRVVMPVRPRRVTSVPATPDSVATEVPAIRAVMQNSDQVAFDEDDMLAPGETENVFADATSFQDFADQLGATALPDLLEAAAVYCAEVLQRPEFSRPLVMRQIAGLPGQAGTEREDYLRGFGTLLRQGRITKVKRGMFALTDRSPYLAEARKIAG